VAVLQGNNVLLGMARRILFPGCKHDEVAVLQGKGGTKKSTGLSVLGGPWYGDSEMDVSNKDFKMIMRGKVLFELAELGSLSRSDQRAVKAFLSQTHDEIRDPYARIPIMRPRRGIFVGTTNEVEYLTDNTGNRRYFPLKTGLVDVEYIREFRDQLFAEACSRVLNGEVCYISGEQDLALVEAMHNESVFVDTWESEIAAFIDGKPSVDAKDLWQLLGISATHRNNGHKMRLSGILRKLGYESTVLRSEGNILRRYVNSTLQKEWDAAFSVAD